MSLTLVDVYRAIDALYHDSNFSGKEQASSWLGEFQKSVFAWKLSDELLQQNRDVSSSYFAAQTMRTKILFSFHELPQESHYRLRDSLVQHVCTVSDQNYAVITQLSLALADLALQMASWKMAVRELIEQMSTNVKFIPALLEILTVFPEELQNRSLRLGSNRRDEVMDEFIQVGPMLLQLLVACTESFDTTDPRVNGKILKCFGAWLVIGALPTVEITHSTLLVSVLSLLGNYETPSILHEVASDCICDALYLVGERTAYVELKQVLLQGTRTLFEPYYLSVKAEYNDKCFNFCRIFSNLAESFVEDIIKTPGRGMGSLRTLDMVLACLENGDREAAEVTFGVWFRLSDFLHKKRNEELMSMFKPYIVRLIAVLCKHCRLGHGFEGVLEDGDDLADFRKTVSELMYDVAFIVGPCDCFRQLFDDLKTQEVTKTWDMSEASLFVMCAVADNIPSDQDEIIPEVLGAIFNLPDSTHVAVQLTSVQLVGKLCEWIEQHPQTIDPVLNFLYKCLHRSQLATVAATALHKICSACAEKMGRHFDALLHITRNVQSFNISDDAAIGLFKGTVLILAEMPFVMISQGMTQLCWIQTGQIFSEVSPKNSLDRLAAIFKDLQVTVLNGETHPCAGIVQEIWPILSETCRKFQHDCEIIESCCNCIRYIIRCVGRQSEPLVESVAKLIVELYRVHQHSCYLYLASILVDQHGVSPAFYTVLVAMMEALCGPTFALLQGPDDLRNYPDTVDDLFRLCTRYLKRMLVPFLQSSICKPILQCALVASSIAHQEANKSVMKFLRHLVYSYRSKCRAEDSKIRRELVSAWLAENGESLITNLVNSCISCQNFFMIADLAEVIYELTCFDRRAVSSWLVKALKGLPMQSSGGSVIATHEQLAAFILEMTTAKSCEDVKMAVKHFTRLYR